MTNKHDQPTKQTDLPELPLAVFVVLALVAAVWVGADWANPCTGQITNWLGCMSEQAEAEAEARAEREAAEAEARAEREATALAAWDRWCREDAPVRMTPDLGYAGWDIVWDYRQYCPGGQSVGSYDDLVRDGRLPEYEPVGADDPFVDDWCEIVGRVFQYQGKSAEELNVREQLTPGFTRLCVGLDAEVTPTPAGEW